MFAVNGTCRYEGVAVNGIQVYVSHTQKPSHAPPSFFSGNLETSVAYHALTESEVEIGAVLIPGL